MTQTQEIIKGLLILAKYPKCSVQAEHDVLYAGPSDVSLIRDEDIDKLESLGWHYDGEGASLARFT